MATAVVSPVEEVVSELGTIPVDDHDDEGVRFLGEVVS